MKQIRKTYKFDCTNKQLIEELCANDVVLHHLFSLVFFKQILYTPNFKMLRMNLCEYTIILSKEFRNNVRLEYWK